MVNNKHNNNNTVFLHRHQSVPAADAVPEEDQKDNSSPKVSNTEDMDTVYNESSYGYDSDSYSSSSNKT